MIQNTINRHRSVEEFPRSAMRVPNLPAALVQPVPVRVNLPLPGPAGVGLAAIEVLVKWDSLAQYDLFRVAVSPVALVVRRAQTATERLAVTALDSALRVVSRLVHLREWVAIVASRSGVVHLAPARLLTEHEAVAARNRTGLHDMKCNKMKES